MTRLPMSRAAAALLRALIARADGDGDRILLSAAESTDWQSLTFTGEQHHLRLHLTGAGAESAYRQLTQGLDDAEFSLPGHIVADIRAVRVGNGDGGSIDVAIEALTIAD